MIQIYEWTQHCCANNWFMLLTGLFSSRRNVFLAFTRLTNVQLTGVVWTRTATSLQIPFAHSKFLVARSECATAFLHPRWMGINIFHASEHKRECHLKHCPTIFAATGGALCCKPVLPKRVQFTEPLPGKPRHVWDSDSACLTRIYWETLI